MGFRGSPQGVLIRGRPALLGWPLSCPVWTIRVSLLCCCRNVEVEIRRFWFSKAPGDFSENTSGGIWASYTEKTQTSWVCVRAWTRYPLWSIYRSLQHVFRIRPSSLVSPSVPERGRFKAAASLFLIRPVFSVCLHLHVSLQTFVSYLEKWEGSGAPWDSHVIRSTPDRSGRLLRRDSHRAAKGCWKWAAFNLLHKILHKASSYPS